MKKVFIFYWLFIIGLVSNGQTTVTKSTGGYSLSGAGASFISPTVIGTGTTSATYSIKIQNSTGANNALMVKDDGFIGLGTSTPARQLSVHGSGSTAPFISMSHPLTVHPFTDYAAADAGYLLSLNHVSDPVAGGFILESFGGTSSGVPQPACRIQGHEGTSGALTFAPVMIESFKSNGSTGRANLSGTDPVLQVFNGLYTPNNVALNQPLFEIRANSQFSSGTSFTWNGTSVLSAGSTTQLFALTAYAGSGEIPSGILLAASDNLSLGPGQGTNGKKLAMNYYNQTQWYSAMEVANVASGFGSLLLMKSGGSVGIGATPTAALDVNSDILRLRTAKTPASAGAAGNAGDICWDSGFIYVCVATNTWKRVAIATW